jgi:hypothetical protein
MADLSSVGFSDLDLEAIRIRLRKMNDQELRRFGLVARFMCSPGANLGKTPASGFCNNHVRVFRVSKDGMFLHNLCKG